jgi:hypothetical protein
VSPCRWDFVSQNCADFGVQRICWVLGVSRAGYYRHLAKGQARAERRAEEKGTMREIRAIHAERQGRMGLRASMLSCVRGGGGSTANASPG